LGDLALALYYLTGLSKMIGFIKFQILACQAFGPTNAKRTSATGGKGTVELSTFTDVTSKSHKPRSKEKVYTLDVSTETRPPLTVLTRNLASLIVKEAI
jgi:hypothetical protein